MVKKSDPIPSDTPLTFSVKGTASCTLFINYNQYAGNVPFQASLFRVGRLQGDPAPIETWFSENLSDEAKTGLHESVSLLKQAPSLLGAVQGNAGSGAVKLTMPAGEAHICYRVDMSPGAEVEFRIGPNDPTLRCYNLINVPKQGPRIAAASAVGADDPQPADLLDGGTWPDPTPPPPPTK